MAYAWRCESMMSAIDAVGEVVGEVVVSVFVMGATLRHAG
jgi:hypothetical protein